MEVYDYVFRAIKKGKLSCVKRFFNPESNDIDSLLTIRSEDGTTPLLMACLSGQLSIVSHLVEKCQANIEEIGTVSIAGRIYDVTPLCCAVLVKNVELVKVLLSMNASINGLSENGRTPLHIACTKHLLEIATYLVKNGADKEIVDEYGETCLMVSCDEVSIELVEMLLENGCNVNQKNSIGRTAMHHAASSGNLAIFQKLLEYGSIPELDSHGVSPLMVAAADGSISIVNYSVTTESCCTEGDKVHALQLLGATFLRQNRNAMERAYECWKYAMELKNEILPLQEPYKPSVMSNILDTVEVSSLSELESIKDDYEKLLLQSLLIKERILGAGHRTCAFNVISYCYRIEFDKALRLLMYVLDSQQKILAPLHDNTRHTLFEIARVFLSMHKEEVPINYDHLIFCLERTVKEMKRGLTNALLNSDLQIEFTGTLHSAMNLVRVLCDNFKDKDLHSALTPLVEMQYQKVNDETPLHLACWKNSSPNVVLALLEAGANPNAVDNYGNTALHVAVLDTSCKEEVFEHLLKNGAHLDYSNASGTTPQQLLAAHSLTYVQPFKYMSLQCLCAQVIIEKQISFSDQVPKALESFITAHRR